jgi:hypothetical protein
VNADAMLWCGKKSRENWYKWLARQLWLGFSTVELFGYDFCREIMVGGGRF